MSRRPNDLMSRARRSRRFHLPVVAALAVICGAGTWSTSRTAAIDAPELPRVMPASGDPYPGRSCTVTMDGGANITKALRAARGGTVVCLTANATYEPFELPARRQNDTGWIILRTGTVPWSEGTRIRPANASSLARIVQTKNGAPALTTGPGAARYALQGLEITTGPAVTQTNALVALGTNGPDQDTMDEVPGQLILSQLYIHGSTNGEMQRCVALNSGATAIVDSWISDCHGKGYDSQAIGGWNGPGPHLIRNNYLEGAGENVMWGGATPSIPGMVAADITFQRNHVYTPVAWKRRWTKKNLLELKNAVRVLIEESVFDGSWTDAQIGPALLFKSINDQGTCNWCRTTDVTVRRSYVKNAAGGIVFSGAENYNSFGKVDSVAKRFLIQDVVFDSLNIPPFTDGGRGIQITGGASDIVFDRTVIAGKLTATLVLDMTHPSQRTAFRNSVWAHSQYFASASGPGIGLPSMVAGVPGFVWQGMTIVRGATLNPLPAGTKVVSSEAAASLAAQIRSGVAAAVRGVITR